MGPWKSIMPPYLCQKAQLALNDITEAIENDTKKCKDVTLINGLSGYLIYKSYLCRFTNYSDKKEMEFILERILNLIFTKKIDGTLMYGLSGIGFSINSTFNQAEDLQKNELLVEIDKYVIQFIDKDIKKANFDFFSGYLGSCLYLLRSQAINIKFKEIVVRKIVYALSATAIENSNGIRWFSASNISHLYPNITDVNKIPKDSNLGLAHGVPSIISMLNFICLQFPQYLEAKKLLDSAIKFMLSEMQKSENSYYFKNFSGISRDIYPSRLGWCYSDLGISLMFLNLSKLLGDKSYNDLAVKIALNSIEISFEKSMVRDGGLCHGAAGNAHMYNRLYQETGVLDFKEASLNWYNILFDKYYNHGMQKYSFLAYANASESNTKEYLPNLGFLNGLSGIGLSIIAGMSEIEPTWDRCLLLS